MGNFGISKDVKSRNASPIGVPVLENDKWVFPIAGLVSVSSHVHKNKKDGSEKDVLDFKFRQANGKEYTRREFVPDEDRANYEKARDGLLSRIKHIYEAFAVFPEKGIGSSAKSYKGLFDAVEKAFEDIKSNNLVHLKLVYYEGNLGFPLNPNFIDKYVKDRPTYLLTVNLQYDTIKQEAPASAGAVGGGNDLPPIPTDMSFDGVDGDEGVF